MVLNVDAVHSDQTVEEKWSLHQYNFLGGSRKTVPLSCRSEDWIKFQRKTVADFRRWQERESEYFLQKLPYLRVFLPILLAESQRLHFPPSALS